MPHSRRKSRPPSDHRNRNHPVPARFEENQVTVDVQTKETLKSKRSKFRRQVPVHSGEHATTAARDLGLILVTDAISLLKSKFTEHQRDRILALLLKFKSTEVKGELEECLERLYIHVDAEIVDLVRIWRGGMLEKVYPTPTEGQHRAVGKKFRYLVKQFQDKLDEYIDALRNECLDFLNYTYGDVDSDSEISDFDDLPIHSPAAGPRPSVVFTPVPKCGSFPEDSDSDTEMADLPSRKYSIYPTIPNRLSPPKQPKKFGEGMFAK